MSLKDFIFTPIFFLLITAGAYLIRPYLTNQETRKYFMPALILRMAAAILVGLLYQFYYGGGDTFQYHTNGSAVLAEAIVEDPEVGISMYFTDNPEIPGSYEYRSRITYFGVPKIFLIMRIAAFIDLFTFRTYSATALIFALISFLGSWAMFRSVASVYQQERRMLAVAILFIPTVVFWGSGIFRDTLTLAAIGFITAWLVDYFVKKESSPWMFLLALVSLYVIYSTKIYLVICLIPSIFLLLFSKYLYAIKNVVFRFFVFAPFAVLMLVLSYVMVNSAVKDNEKYSLNAIAETARVTAYDIAYYTGRSAGSTYTLGELDGTWQSMISLAPAAINVSLFRPYVWEVNNPLMLLSALESLAVALLTLFLCTRMKFSIFQWVGRNPVALYCIFLSLGIAFAVGVSTFNFGTLSRYRIPVLPFFLVGLIIAYHDYKYHSTEENKKHVG